MSTRNIYLFPRDPESKRIPQETLAASLTEIGFIHEKIPNFPWSFWQGPRFHEWMDAANAPVDNRQAISLMMTDAIEPLVSASVRGVKPRCACGISVEDWGIPLHVLPWDDKASRRTFPCPTCGKENYPWDWDWDHHAGFARQHIELADFACPPSQPLLEFLSRLNSCPWTWTDYYV